MPTSEQAKQLLRALRVLIVTTLLLFFVLLGLIIYVARQAEQERRDLARASIQATLLVARSETRTNNALCALRADEQDRVNQSKQFLKEHPTGVGGITASEIRVSLDNEAHTLKALSTLDCPAIVHTS